jgi:hypothetical protein
MSEGDFYDNVILGQPVHLRTDPSQKVGYIVAVMMKSPYDALVRWTDAGPTFEALDDLIEAVPEQCEHGRTIPRKGYFGRIRNTG